MLQPKRAKYRKAFRGKIRGKSIRASQLNFGEYGLKALTNGWVSAAQIEAARRALAHHTKRGGRIWIRIFPDKPVSKKPAETRMGGGKGDVVKFISVVKAGRIVFEMSGVDESIAQEAMNQAAAKLAIQTKFVTKK